MSRFQQAIRSGRLALSAELLPDPGREPARELERARRLADRFDAVIVNPHDRDEVADGIATAINLPLEERRQALLKADPADFGIYEGEIKHFLKFFDDMEAENDDFFNDMETEKDDFFSDMEDE